MTLAELLAIDAEVLGRGRLVAFTTPVIVPADILARLAYGAYNFHPGPPQYPGLTPAQFAVYEQAREFGATAHAMAARVDAGPIVAVELFEVAPGATVLDLELGSYRALAHLFWGLAGMLATQAEPLRPLGIEWGGQKSSRRSYEALCDIPLDISREDLERRISAFGGNYFGITPSISLHGFRFNLVAPAAPEVPRWPQD